VFSSKNIMDINAHGKM